MSDKNLLGKIMMFTQWDIEYLLNLREYKKNPKKLYKQLQTLKEKGKTPTAKRVTKNLLVAFEKVRSPEEFPELWI